MSDVEVRAMPADDYDRAFRGIEETANLMKHEDINLEFFDKFVERKIVFLLQDSGLFHSGFINLIGQLNDLLQDYQEAISTQNALAFTKAQKEIIKVIEQLARNIKKSQRYVKNALDKVNELLDDEHRIKLKVAKYYVEINPVILEEGESLEEERARVTALIEADLKNMKSVLERLYGLFITDKGKAGKLLILIELLKKFRNANRNDAVRRNPKIYRIELMNKINSLVRDMNRIKKSAINIERLVAQEEVEFGTALSEREKFLNRLMASRISLKSKMRQAAS